MISNNHPQVLAALSVSLGSLVVGFSSGYTSPAIPSMKDVHDKTFDMNIEQVIRLTTKAVDWKLKLNSKMSENRNLGLEESCRWLVLSEVLLVAR